MFKAQIIGVGTDIVELARLEKSISRTGDAFLQKVYAPGELDALPAQERRRLEFLGGRWAAKEALAKALGTGVGDACRMNEVIVLNDGQAWLGDNESLLRDCPIYREIYESQIGHGGETA